MKNLFQKSTRRVSLVVNRLASLQFVREQSGADMVEYTLVLALVSLAGLVALHTLGNSIGSALNNVSAQISSNL